MIRSLRWMIAAAFALLPSVALAQSTLLQGGSWSTGRIPMYVGQTGGQVIVQDSGPASGGGPGIGISEWNVTARGTGTAPYAGQGTGPNGEVACIFDAPATNSTGTHSLCFSANVSSGGLISYQANGAASSFPLNFKVNGTTYQFPFSISGVLGPASSVIGDAACWNNTAGTLLADCGPFVTVGGNNTWTGTNNFTGPFKIGGVTETFPASGNIVGTSDAQTLTNKSIGASEINSGTLSGTVMPAYTGDVTSSAGATINTIAANAVTNAKLATATQNTVKGAATSTTIADLTMPSCSGASNALQWVTSTGFQCGTLGATTAGWGLTLSGGGVFSVSTAAPPFGYDFPINMGLTASVGASALTINLRTAAGNAPSATDPVLIPFRSGTLATGTVSWTAITSALSIVVPSAATLGTSNNVPFRIWLFATYNAGTPQLGVAICSISTTVYPCVMWETTRKTSIAIDGFSTSGGVLYATTAVSNDPVRIIGFAEYSAGLATAGAYASTPTTLQVFGPGMKKPGDLIQSVYGQTGAYVSTASTYSPSATNPTTAASVASATAAITPTSGINVVRVNGQALVTSTSANQFITAFLYNGSALVAVGAGANSSANTGVMIPLVYQSNNLGTSSITYTVYATSSAGTTGVNGQAAAWFTSGTGNLGNTFLRAEEIMGAMPEPANDNIDPGVFSATG